MEGKLYSMCIVNGKLAVVAATYCVFMISMQTQKVNIKKYPGRSTMKMNRDWAFHASKWQ